MKTVENMTKTEQLLKSSQVRAYTSAVPTRAGPPYKPADTGTYDGRELRPFDGRPGAMDAFKLPSLTPSGRRVR